MATNTADAVSVARTSRADNGTEKPTTRTRRARANADEETNACARYFLAKPDSNGGTPALGREVASEGEALVEALRLGVTYYAIQEFRVIPDFAGKRPQLNKEAVHGK